MAEKEKSSFKTNTTIWIQILRKLSRIRKAICCCRIFPPSLLQLKSGLGVHNEYAEELSSKYFYFYVDCLHFGIIIMSLYPLTYYNEYRLSSKVPGKPAFIRWQLHCYCSRYCYILFIVR